MSEKIYKNTLNLPTTPFPMKANLAQREPAMLAQWETQKVHDAIRTRAAGRPKYILHDGPPYANGSIHIGHALNKILKDIIIRYKVMCGFDSYYVPGWDCHGLPIEHALFKELKITKDQIDQVTFRKKARAYAEKYVDIQRKDFIRLGIFGDWAHPYLTMSYNYQATIMESFARLYRDKFVYKGEKPIHWCAECETALAEAELEYADKVSDSIYVTFVIDGPETASTKLGDILKRCGLDSCAIVVWTTTPWTLPANVAVAVHPHLDYVLFETPSHDTYICAVDRLDVVKEVLGVTDGTVVATIKGSDLEHAVYRHPFIARTGTIRLATFVSNEDGSGCVHIAPGHGQDDYQLGLSCKLPILSPVDGKGRFTDAFPPAKGIHVVKANGMIIDMLAASKHLLGKFSITHSYPHCWRCKKPVIFRATKQWFLDIEHKNLRKRLMDTVTNAHETTWIPAWGKNRILGMLESRPDWCLSRQRYWGVPIPIVYCEKCGADHLPALFDGMLKRVRAEGADVWFSMNGTELMGAGTLCSQCGHGSFRKESDIVDVWFDSGVSHQAVLKHNDALGFPSALYLEGSDQHRGWFQTSLITALALENEPPFKTVVTHGFTVDGEGKKMSKSAGNVVAPQDIIKTYGADILRLWVSSCDISQDVRISDDIIKQMADAYRKIRNTLRYFLSNLYDFEYTRDKVAFTELESIDVWAIGKSCQLVKDVTENYESFRFHNIYRLIYSFCNDEMSSFYLDILKDRLYTAKASGRERRSSQTALFYIVRNLVKLIAPILPFTADEVWQSYVLEPGLSSVHLAAWPEPPAQTCMAEEVADWDLLKDLRTHINPFIEKKRASGDIGSSLEAKVELTVVDTALYQFLGRYKTQLPFALIVSQVTLTQATALTASHGDVIVNEKNEPRYAITIHKAEGTKCERCWNYSVDVGRATAHPTLCPKCVQAIG